MAFHCCGIDGAHTRDCATGREEEAARLREAIAAAAPSRSYEARTVAARERLANAMTRIAVVLEAMASKDKP